MYVSWKPLTLTEARGFVLSYTVLYHENSRDAKRQIYDIIVPGSESSTVIGDLNPSSVYQVYVRASTSAGDGPYNNLPVIAQSMLLFSFS